MLQWERYMQQIRDFLEKPVIKIIIGMRHSDKTTLLELTRQRLLECGRAGKHCLLGASALEYSVYIGKQNVAEVSFVGIR